jgi:hypothetical protein
MGFTYGGSTTAGFMMVQAHIRATKIAPSPLNQSQTQINIVVIDSELGRIKAANGFKFVTRHSHGSSRDGRKLPA